MNDRRSSPPGADGNGDGVPPDPRQDPRFGWLYGDRGQAAGSGTPGGAGPEPTRVLPVQPRPANPNRPPDTRERPAPPPRPALQPGGRPPGTKDHGGYGSAFAWFWMRRLRNPFFYLRVLLLVLVLWIAYTVAVPFATWKSVDKVAWEPSGDRPADQPGTTYLLVGSDSRAGLSKEERRHLHTGNAASTLTDTIMLLHTGDGPNVLLSIPRDSDVPSSYGSGNGMINGLYGKGGYPLLTRYLEDATGIRIDKFVEIGLGGVAGVVDAIGGIEICPKSRMDDKDAGLHIKKGCQNADGRTALAYSRSRHAQAHGDLDRVRHQREVVAAIGDKVLSPWTVINPIRWWRLNHAVPGFFAFGKGMSTVDAGKWASAMTHTTGSSGMTCTMPVTDSSAHTWDLKRAKPIFSTFIDDDTDNITPQQCTPTGLAGVK